MGMEGDSRERWRHEVHHAESLEGDTRTCAGVGCVIRHARNFTATRHSSKLVDGFAIPLSQSWLQWNRNEKDKDAYILKHQSVLHHVIDALCTSFFIFIINKKKKSQADDCPLSKLLQVKEVCRVFVACVLLEHSNHSRGSTHSATPEGCYDPRTSA